MNTAHRVLVSASLAFGFAAVLAANAAFADPPPPPPSWPGAQPPPPAPSPAPAPTAAPTPTPSPGVDGAIDTPAPPAPAAPSASPRWVENPENLPICPPPLDPCWAWNISGEPCPPCIAICGEDWMLGHEYVPTVPINETRAAITVIATPPTPFLSSEGEAGTPKRGRVSLNFARLSDERVLTDNAGNTYASDGEIQMVTAEYVSPRIAIPVLCATLPIHVGVSLTAYTLNDALLDGLRNWVEEDLLSASPSVLAAHDIGGRELSVTDPALTKTDLLGSAPMWKAKAFVKFDLPDMHPSCTHIRSAFSIGVTAPAFGSHSESGNRDWQPEATWAFAAPIVNRLRLTGAVTICLPGDTDTYEALGLKHKDVILGANASLEYWASWRFAIAFGVSWNSHYTTRSGLPTDLDSWYGNLGILYRLSCRSDLHLIFAENPDAAINTAFGSDFSNSQKDADFTMALGWSFAF